MLLFQHSARLTVTVQTSRGICISSQAAAQIAQGRLLQSKVQKQKTYRVRHLNLHYPFSGWLQKHFWSSKALISTADLKMSINIVTQLYFKWLCLYHPKIPSLNVLLSNRKITLPFECQKSVSGYHLQLIDNLKKSNCKSKKFCLLCFLPNRLIWKIPQE